MNKVRLKRIAKEGKYYIAEKRREFWREQIPSYLPHAESLTETVNCGNCKKVIKTACISADYHDICLPCCEEILQESVVTEDDKSEEENKTKKIKTEDNNNNVLLDSSQLDQQFKCPSCDSNEDEEFIALDGGSHTCKKCHNMSHLCKRFPGQWSHGNHIECCRLKDRTDEDRKKFDIHLQNEVWFCPKCGSKPSITINFLENGVILSDCSNKGCKIQYHYCVNQRKICSRDATSTCC